LSAYISGALPDRSQGTDSALSRNTVKDLLTDEQLEAREFWQERHIPDLNKTLRFPGPFARIRFPSTAPEPELKPKPGQLRLPFQGVKVLDFSWIVTGPWITQWLALYGAEVVKIESSKTGSSGRRSRGRDFGFVAWNSAKKSLTLNLKHPRSMELARRLVGWADVVVENFSPGTMQRMGLGYEELTRMNPHVILFSASMMGGSGPHTAQPGLGQILSTLSGFTELTGWPDRLPVTAHGPYTDVISCRMGAVALFAALEYQRRTGKGCQIDFSQFESSTHFLAPLILEYQANGNLLRRMGNRSLADAPHGVFPCRGEDRWCALSVSDAEWQAFLKVMAG
jgi:benzylsuccinate CoA-transferase BbsF subunit